MHTDASAHAPVCFGLCTRMFCLMHPYALADASVCIILSFIIAVRFLIFVVIHKRYFHIINSSKKQKEDIPKSKD